MRLGPTATLAAAIAVMALSGCFGIGEDDDAAPQRYSTWPLMHMEIEDVRPHNDTRACPFPYQHQPTCHEVEVDVRLENLHRELDICLCDVWIVAQVSDGALVQPARSQEPASERLGGADDATLHYTWSLPPGTTLERLRLEHTRPYYDSEGATPVRLMADIAVPEY